MFDAIKAALVSLEKSCESTKGFIASRQAALEKFKASREKLSALVAEHNERKKPFKEQADPEEVNFLLGQLEADIALLNKQETEGWQILRALRSAYEELQRNKVAVILSRNGGSLLSPSQEAARLIALLEWFGDNTATRHLEQDLQSLRLEAVIVALDSMFNFSLGSQLRESCTNISHAVEYANELMELHYPDSLVKQVELLTKFLEENRLVLEKSASVAVALKKLKVDADDLIRGIFV